MSKQSSDLSAIKQLLEDNEISHLNLLNFINISSNDTVRLEHVIKLLENVQYYQEKMFNNKKSKEYVDDVHKRMDKLRQYVCKWLIHHNYQEFWIVQDIPLAVECYIRNSNNVPTVIDEILTERVKKSAQQQKTSYEAIIHQLRIKLYGNDKQEQEEEQ